MTPRTHGTESLLAEDLAGRRAAQSEFRRPVVLEAGAGTGKTTTLVARVLAWSLGPGWEAAGGEDLTPDRQAADVLDAVVAITFTESAAAEMATRVAAGLADVAAGREGELVGFDAALLPAGLDAEKRRRRARALLGALDHLRVSTIHAFCRGLLAASPLEARLHPDLRVDADGLLLEEIAAEVVQGAVRRAYGGSGDEPLVALGVRGRGPQAVAEAVRDLAQRGVPAAALEADPFAPERVASLRERLAATLDRFAEAADGRLETVRRGPKAAEVAAAVAASRRLTDEAEAAPGASGAAAVGRLRAGLGELWDKSLVGRLSDWTKGKLTGSEEQAIGERKAALALAAAELLELLELLLALDPPLLDLARRALAPVLAEVEAELRSRGVATFQALLSEARDLLVGNSAVRRRERGRIRQLLVDEFQDTDRLQCDIVRALALEGDEASRLGLFVVGDPKQSIFGWRDADLAAYDEFVAAALAAGGERYRLSVNYRSAPPILDEVERTVGPLMSYESGFQAEFTPLLPSPELEDAPGFQGTTWRPIEIWISWLGEAAGGAPAGAATRAEDAVKVEARAVAADLRALHDEAGVTWRDCALLFRSSSPIETFLAALRDREVPFVVDRDKHYYRRREIIEAAALIRAVIDPVDHLALVTYLRSAGVGVPDAALLPLWGRDFPALLTDLDGPGDRLERIAEVVREAATEVPRGVPGLEALGGWPASLIAAVETLAELRRSFREDTPGAFIEAVRERTLVEVTEAARYHGRFRLANLERFFRHLQQAMEERGGDTGALLRLLRRSVGETREAEEALPRDASLDAVQVLTVHRAKGLEFGHVYLVQLHAEVSGGERPEIDADERRALDGPWEYRLFGAPTPSFDGVERRRRRVASAEQLRLLYVAMTRARERLVLVGRWPEAPALKPPGEASTLLDLVQNREPVPASIADLEAGLDAAGADLHEARWKSLARLPAEAPRRAAAERAPGLPTVEEIEAAGRRLAEARSRAAARMERPLGRAVTAGLDERPEAEPDPTAGARERLAGRRPALAVGSAIHRLFETWDLAAPLEAELERQRDLTHERLAALLAGRDLEAARKRAGEQLDRLARGELLRRFTSLGPVIVAREMPVLLPPGEGDREPLGYLSGTIDLVLRDPGGTRWTVVDFKTDPVDSETELEEAAARYAPQAAAYARAVREACGLPEPPRAELWFVWPDRVWPLP